MRRAIVVLVTAAATLLALAGCGGQQKGGPLGGNGGGGGSNGTIIVGSVNFYENTLLAEIYAQALEAKGLKVTRKFNIGTREATIPALGDGSINLLPEYSGNLLSYIKNGKVKGKNPSADEVYTQTQDALKAGFKTAKADVKPGSLLVLDKAAAEDKDSVAVTKKTAAKYKLKSIADLKPVANKIVLGGPPEWQTRFTGVPGLKQLYGLNFKSFKKLDAGGPLSTKALKSGTVDACNLFTTDPGLSTNGFVALDDPKHLFLPQNVTPLIAKKSNNAKVSDALNAVSAKLTTDNLFAMDKQVSVDKKDPAVVAKQFLSDNGLT